MRIKLLMYFILLNITLFCYQNCSVGFQSSSVEDTAFDSNSRHQDLTPVLTNTPGELGFFKQRGSLVSPEPKLRLLSGVELKNTLQTLTGYAIKQELSFADESTGFKNGDQLNLDVNILESLISISELAVFHYLQNNALINFTCLKNNFTQSCHDKVIVGFAERAYRRPLKIIESTKLKSLYQEVNSLIKDNMNSLVMVLGRILISPQFLYKSEVGNLSGVMDNYEKAVFISYSLTGDMPDKELYGLAKLNKLTAVEIENQTRRLMSTEKSKKWLTTFFKDWLRLGKLSRMLDDPNRFSKFTNKNIPKILNDEFNMFIESVVFNKNGTSSDLLTHKSTYVNSETAFIYNSDLTSNKMVEIDQGEGRLGILTLASVMASHSSEINIEKDQPVSRGVLIKNQILCESVGIPSGLSLTAAEDKIRESHPNYDNYTVRRQYEVGMNQAKSCITCHSQFMPFGYLSSNFNALGEYKFTQKNQPITSEATPRISRKNYTFNGISELIPKLAESNVYKHCFSQKIGMFLFGNAEETIRGQLSWLVYDHHESSGGNIKNMIGKTLADPRVYQRRSK